MVKEILEKLSKRKYSKLPMPDDDIEELLKAAMANFELFVRN